ncbi:MAG: hypothetical protein HGGPFJEG_02421 [Ignavibacteria bacterium]|nr:hypothetical protein [Ignavibacteria bacterium]
MRKIFIFFLIFANTFFIYIYSGFAYEKVYSKSEINSLAHRYVKNNLGIKNPVVVDMDCDGDFDILKFNKNGKVDFYKNSGNTESPFFELEKKNFDDYEVHSLLKGGLPATIFFADNDGDGDKDVFGVYENGFDVKSGIQKYNVTYAENSFDVSHYTLITIILVLIIILLIVTIL